MTIKTGAAREVRMTVIAPVAVVAVALAIYAPWIPRPFDIVDFAEFLHFLRGDGGLVSRISEFLDFYIGRHGRLNLVGYGGLFFKWELFGDNAMAWHWLRVAQMLVLVALVYKLARRIGFDLLGATAAAMLFIVAQPAREGWYRLTLGEPLGIQLMLGAMLLATGWREDPSRARGWGIALLIAGGILAKEMLVGLTPLVLGLGAWRTPTGGLDPRSPVASWRQLAAWVLVPAMVTFGAAVVVGLGAEREGISTLYGGDPWSLAHFLTLVGRPWQVDGFEGSAPWAPVPANVLFLVVIAIGIWRAWRGEAAERRHRIMIIGCALAMTLVHAVLYLPWPWPNHYYAMPFLLGPALLFGSALTRIGDQVVAVRSVVIGATLLLLAVAGLGAARDLRVSAALQRTHGGVIAQLVGRQAADSVFVVRPGVGRYSWIGTAPSLRNFALGIGAATSLPPAVDRTCSSMRDIMGPHGGRVVVVTYLSACGALAVRPSAQIRDTIQYFVTGWTSVRRVTATVGADLLDVQRPSGSPGRP